MTINCLSPHLQPGAPGHKSAKEVYPEPGRPTGPLQPKAMATAFALFAGVLLPCWGAFPQFKRGLAKVSQRAFRAFRCVDGGGPGIAV